MSGSLLVPGLESSGVASTTGLGASTLGLVEWSGSLFSPGLGGRLRDGLLSDLELFFRPSLGEGDLALGADGDLAIDSGLGTAVLVSLFTDRRAQPDDQLPDATTDPRGWWGDSISLVAGDRIGSRLWLLDRAKATGENRTRAEEYSREALAWLLEDRIAEQVEVEARFIRDAVDVQLCIEVSIIRPSGELLQGRFSFVWGES